MPGTGLSRLLMEVVKRGYGGQGNEFSYQMLLVSNYMLNHVFEAHSVSGGECEHMMYLYSITNSEDE